MKKIFYILLAFFTTKVSTFADDNNNILGINETDLKKGNIHLSDIPNAIIHAINYLIAIAGTISLIFIIVGAYQILFSSISGNVQKGKETITLAIFGFAIASLAYIMVKFLVDNLAV